MELDKQSVQRYEEWRQLWFLQTPAQAICVFHQHGMAGALHLTAPGPAPDPAPVPVHAAVPDEFLQQAVFMIRSILPSTYNSNVNPFQL